VNVRDFFYPDSCIMEPLLVVSGFLLAKQFKKKTVRKRRPEVATTTWIDALSAPDDDDDDEVILGPGPRTADDEPRGRSVASRAFVPGWMRTTSPPRQARTESVRQLSIGQADRFSTREFDSGLAQRVASHMHGRGDAAVEPEYIRPPRRGGDEGYDRMRGRDPIPRFNRYDLGPELTTGLRDTGAVRGRADTAPRGASTSGPESWDILPDKSLQGTARAQHLLFRAAPLTKSKLGATPVRQASSRASISWDNGSTGRVAPARKARVFPDVDDTDRGASDRGVDSFDTGRGINGQSEVRRSALAPSDTLLAVQTPPVTATPHIKGRSHLKFLTGSGEDKKYSFHLKDMLRSDGLTKAPKPLRPTDLPVTVHPDVRLGYAQTINNPLRSATSDAPRPTGLGGDRLPQDTHPAGAAFEQSTTTLDSMTTPAGLNVPHGMGTTTIGLDKPIQEPRIIQLSHPRQTHLADIRTSTEVRRTNPDQPPSADFLSLTTRVREPVADRRPDPLTTGLGRDGTNEFPSTGPRRDGGMVYDRVEKKETTALASTTHVNAGSFKGAGVPVVSTFQSQGNAGLDGQRDVIFEIGGDITVPIRGRYAIDGVQPRLPQENSQRQPGEFRIR
jgi:hypothetical protein